MRCYVRRDTKGCEITKKSLICKKSDSSKSDFLRLQLVSKDGDSVVKNLGNKVNYPCDSITDTGKGNE